MEGVGCVFLNLQNKNIPPDGGNFFLDKYGNNIFYVSKHPIQNRRGLVFFSHKVHNTLRNYF
jgi:hypothetical protein